MKENQTKEQHHKMALTMKENPNHLKDLPLTDALQDNENSLCTSDDL